MKNINCSKSIKPVLISTLVALIYGCGSDGDGSLTSGRGGTANSMFSLDITDAPVDGADAVWVQFSGVTLQPAADNAQQERLEFPFDIPKQINLLDLQGNKVQVLLAEEIIPAGKYDWMRLDVDVVPGVRDTYIVISGAEHELDIPGGSQSGLKINTGFELIANAEFNYTLDFDLRKSIVMSNGDYKLKPTLKLINNAESGTIKGSVNSALLTGAAGCSDAVLNTGNAVYLFDNKGVTPDDVDNQPENPSSSAIVELNNATGNYEYTLGFIPQGEYTISFTCQADQDDPETNDTIVFTGTSNVTLSAAQILEVNF